MVSVYFGFSGCGHPNTNPRVAGIACLCFIGKALDVNRWLIEYELKWDWACGYCAGQYVWLKRPFNLLNYSR